jgi:hypothetical protein
MSNLTLLTWVQLYNKSPISYSLYIYNNFYKIIPQKISLFYKKIEIFKNIFNYFKYIKFIIYYYLFL